ncbi:MAG: hypothetical protein ACE3L7_32320 [Candidatus Pristimantibacillus sp.]
MSTTTSVITGEIVKIRAIEKQIYDLLCAGIMHLQEIADAMDQSYSSVNSTLSRMVLYDIAKRQGGGIYAPVIKNYVTGPDEEVITQRRNSKRGHTNDVNQVGQTPTEIVTFIEEQYKLCTSKNDMISKLKSHGVIINRYMLNQIIYTFGIEKRNPIRNKQSEALLNISAECISYVRELYADGVELEQICAELSNLSIEMDLPLLVRLINTHDIQRSNLKREDVKELMASGMML